MGALEIMTLIVGLGKLGVDVWQAFVTQGAEAALKLLDRGLSDGKVAVAEMLAKLAANDKKADDDLAGKFPVGDGEGPTLEKVIVDALASIPPSEGGGPSGR